MKVFGETISNPKERGEWAELRFMARATEEGFRVSKPWGDSARYDFALEANGRFLSVQVKSSIFRSGTGYRCSMQPTGYNGASRRYTTEQVDFFAAYIIPEDLWYILPAKIADDLVGKLRVSPNNKHHKYERYKEAWHLLREAVAKTDANGVPDPSASFENDARTPEPAATPSEMIELRGEVEPPAAPGFDADLLRGRMAGCFDRLLRRR
jgi:hypothetical protein